MKASDMLRNNNGLKTTQSVLNKQQSGVDAANKVAQTQAPVFTQQQLDAAGKKVDQMNAATPTDDAMKAAMAKTIATQQAIANGVDVNQGVPSDEEDKPSVPIVKKEEPEEQPKQLSYADMYKILNPELNETAEQRANREKKERTKARIAALGDGLRALSNIYFATKGAKVVHNPESDMTKAVNKRKAYMDAQREKNRTSWLAGYQRALALDEQARKNNLTLAEQMRYHHNVDRVNRAKVKLDQMRIEQQDEYNKSKLSNQESANKETVRHHKEMESTSRKNANANMIRAQKAGKNKGGSSKENYNKTLAGLTTKDPNGVRAVTRSLKRAGVPQNAQTIVEAYREQKGFSSSNGRTLHGIK